MIFETWLLMQFKVLRFPKSTGRQVWKFWNPEFAFASANGWNWFWSDCDGTERSGEETSTTTLNSRRAACQHHQTFLTDYKETSPSPLWPQASSTTHVATQSNVYVRACVRTYTGPFVVCLSRAWPLQMRLTLPGAVTRHLLKRLAAADLVQVLHLKSVRLRQLISLSSSGSGSRTVVKNGSHWSQQPRSAPRATSSLRRLQLCRFSVNSRRQLRINRC